MRVSDDDGMVLDAEYHVQPDGDLFALILESRSGGGRAGSSLPRNPDYNRALTILLTRLSRVDAVMADALVDSRRTLALSVPEADRRIVAGPVRLSQQPDLDALRRRMGTAQAKVGQSPDAKKPGNSTKRIRLRLQVPGYSLREADKLAADLATSPTSASRTWPSAHEVLRSLIGEEIWTVDGVPSMVLAVHGQTAVVGTSRSPQSQAVEVGDVQDGMDKLRARGTLRITVEELGHSSAFVGAVLAVLPGVSATANPATVTLSAATARASTDPEFAVLDSVASVKVRREQTQLRSMLASGRELAGCALCGHQYPLLFLVAAHIKKRSICTDDERRDLHHVAMLACTFGCDALYEAGWVTVGPDGRILTIPTDVTPVGRLRDHLDQVAGQTCSAHSQDSEQYFAWHRTTIFRGND
jgi:hypothetical protein